MITLDVTVICSFMTLIVGIEGVKLTKTTENVNIYQVSVEYQKLAQLFHQLELLCRNFGDNCMVVSVRYPTGMETVEFISRLSENCANIGARIAVQFAYKDDIFQQNRLIDKWLSEIEITQLEKEIA